MSTNKSYSYTAADSLPVKLLQSDFLDGNRLIPRHIQFIPTNRCNLKCVFCSCAKDDRKTECDMMGFHDMVTVFRSMDTVAVTITGGGEPLLHKSFNEIVFAFRHKGISVGLVTNGLKLHDTDAEILSWLKWCRISHADFRPFSDEYARSLAYTITRAPSVDWAISYVVSPDPKFQQIADVINFANAHNLTHVRLVADLHQPWDVPMDVVRSTLEACNVDTSRVIFQGRDKPVRGGDCYIGYVKPVIAADGRVYACCGAQYAIKGKEGAMPEELCMGHWSDFGKLDTTQPIVSAGTCDVCYYNEYNRILAASVQPVEHGEFV